MTETIGTRWRKPTKRKRSESVEVTDNADDDDDDNVDDNDDKEGVVKGGGSSSCKKLRGENVRECSSSKAGPKDYTGDSSSKGARKDDNDGNYDNGDNDEVHEEEDDKEDEQEE
ncbi:uncharacterized protein LAJ45_08627 [Morchella importuna]|uniref:uncharacterized protein n=1 Tax=Morchella importuna TaxID=1174673 RepID=UPI001E8E24DD|nr:uncharacterized protein LAJ45_08627 [Morchella importuna]KAH8147470.1 hypothetical protein LAJ45_08627 [Morchella importuna]